MKFEKPIFLIAHPSDIKEFENLILIDDALFLDFREKYFFKKDFFIDKQFQTVAISPNKCQLIYLLDEKNQFWIFDLKSKSIEKVKCVKKDFFSPKDMAIRKNVLYVIDENSLIAISLTTWQTLWIINSKSFSLKSLAVDEFNIYVLNGNEVLKFDFGGRLKNVKEFENPVSIFTKENKLYVLETSKIWKEGEEIKLPDEISSPISFTINSKGNFYIGSDDTNEVKLWEIDETGTLTDKITTYEKICKKLLFDNKDNLWILNKDGSLSLINPIKIYKEIGELKYIFDSTIPQCEWHRLLINIETPKDTSFDIKISAKDILDKKSDSFFSFSNLKDILLYNIKGRFLEVKITLKSDPKRENSPILKSLKAFFPKETYLKYLPAIYQEDKEGKEILERFLSIFQNIFEDIENKIESSHLLIDPETTRDEFLNWLSTWLGLIREEIWSDEKWRKFLGKAMDFFKMRGTRKGLENLIELFTGEKPIIIESFQLKYSKIPFKLGNFSFCVLIKPKQIKTEKEFEAIKRLIKNWKPAHTEGKVVLLNEQMLLGNLLFLGINTYLKPRRFILEKAILPIDTKLSDIEESTQIERHALLEIDTKLNY